MAGFSFTGVVAGFASTVNTFLFGKDDNKHKPPPSTNSSSRSSGATWPPHQPSPPSYTRGSYARDQTAGWPPPTSDYGRSFYDSKYTSPHVAASPPPASTSAHAQASHQRSPDPAHNSKSYQSSQTPPRTPYSPPVYDPSDSESEIEYIEDDDIAKELRGRARRQHREMRDARARAKDAHKRGDNVAGHRHEQEATARKNAMDQLNAKAAKIIFYQKNKGHKEGTVDLHGLHVQEAIQYAKQELQSASWRDDVVVRFIVGKGLHAEDGRAKIRPALEELCNERGLIHSLDPRNTGMLIVQLD